MKRFFLYLSVLCLLASCSTVRHARNGHRYGVADDGGAVTLFSDGRPILSYRYEEMPAPSGVRGVYSRGGFIHPAYTPSGFVLTTVQPRDHRHHYGIWNPWTRVEFEGKVYDTWNLGDSLGTVRAGKVVPVSKKGECGFDADLNHIAFAPGGEKVMMKETWKVRAHEVEEGFLWDFISILEPATSSPVTIKAYRYQGFSIRANETWTRNNCTMRTSEGLGRSQIDGSRADWIYVDGETGTDTRGGFLFLASPDNVDSPEQLRIWNEDANGKRGDVFVNFCPAKSQDFRLEPGNKYVLRYRVLTYDGTMNPSTANRLWEKYISENKQKEK